MNDCFYTDFNKPRYENGKYKISVIIPVYNAEKYLDKCVRSVLAQTYLNKEIVLVNDGSRDGSGKICERYAEHFSNVRLVNKNNGGLVSAWKAGLEIATGDYIVFLDSDDWIDPHMLRDMSVYLTGSNREIVASNYRIVQEDGSFKPVFQKLKEGEYDRNRIEEEIIPNLLGHENRYIHMSRCMKIISRQMLLDNVCYCKDSIRMGEDSTIMLPCLMDCEHLYVMPHIFYNYLKVDDSMIHKYDEKLYDNNKDLYRVLKNILLCKCTEDKKEHMLAQLDKEYVLLLLLVLKNEARGNPESYIQNIRRICKDPDIRAIVKATPVELKEKSNCLLYWTLVRPSLFRMLMLRLAMIIYYRKGRSKNEFIHISSNTSA